MKATEMNKLQTTADVNGNSAVMDAELEVKKLQELVRKLELQNEQLRTKVTTNYNPNGCVLQPQSCSPIPASGHFYSGNRCISAETAQFGHNTDEQYACFHAQFESDGEETLLDQLQILDLLSLLNLHPEFEDHWLYVSPKAKLFPKLPLSPLQWCRHVLDNPGPEVELAKRSLCYRLEQAKRWRGVLSCSASSLVSYRPVDGFFPLSTSVKSFPKPALTEQTAPSSPSSHCSLQPPLFGRSCGGLAERSPSFLDHTASHNYSRPHAAVSPQSSMNNEFSIPELNHNSITMDYKLQDMTDVQVMARLQEESLRQDYATTSATGAHRSSSFSVHSGLRRPERTSVRMEEDEEEDYDDLPPPQLRLFRTSSMQRSVSHSHNLSSLRESCRCSPSSTQYFGSTNPSTASWDRPSTASYTSTETQSYRSSTDTLRRSMPNLIRAPSMLSVPSVPNVAAPSSHTAVPVFQPSVSSLRNSQSFDSSSGLARLQSAIPSPGQLQQRVQSISNFTTATRQPVKATAYVSPTIQGAITMPSSVSLNSLSSISISKLSKPTTPSSTNRSSLPRPASFIGTIGTPRNKIALPGRSLLTPPKSIASLSALRDASWKDGCY